ncbi:M23 family metallopeptidase [Breznakiella homolactica]|uniref:Uncharacterized protein n=2 Tax=Breznakiella homolactica TaxID=2798577 RepID=A0A7T7XRW0_9SPIR|nr:M23 family metallopeptidase [Breznakiella homolactica]
MDWPDPEAPVLYDFGYNSGRTPTLGYSFVSEGPVRSVDSGELIFARDENDRASKLPSPMGAWLAMDHGDGLIGIYGRMKNREQETSVLADQGSILGFSGRSGWTPGNGFYFSFYDRKEHRWVNPAMILPPVPDTRAPLIVSVTLLNQEDRRFNPVQQRTIPQGLYSILVESNDTRTTARDTPLSPHRIICSVNGVEAGSLHFETLSARNGVLLAARNRAAPAEQVYAPYPSLEIGEVWLNRGLVTMEVIVQDIAGNSRNVTYRLTVE